MSDRPKPGTILWRDLTVDDAATIRDFYCDVVGWTASDHDMGDYADFDIRDSDGEVVTGICHRRGSNAGVPPQWILYVAVESVDAAVERCRARGGRVVDGPRTMGKSSFCVIEDPAGAVLGLIEG